MSADKYICGIEQNGEILCLNETGFWYRLTDTGWQVVCIASNRELILGMKVRELMDEIQEMDDRLDAAGEALAGPDA